MLIINGRVLDPLTRFDGKALIGVKGGQIAVIEPGVTGTGIYNTDTIIDASGKVVSPGFINIHGHEREMQQTLRTAVLDVVTTTAGGQCGFSPGFPEPGEPLGDYYTKIEGNGLAGNFTAMAGHDSMRVWAGITDSSSPADESQIERMRQQLYLEMEEGALGISFGPGFHLGASFNEMLVIAKETDVGREQKSFEPTAKKVLDLFAAIKIIWLSDGTSIERQLPKRYRELSRLLKMTGFDYDSFTSPP